MHKNVLSTSQKCIELMLNGVYYVILDVILIAPLWRPVFHSHSIHPTVFCCSLKSNFLSNLSRSISASAPTCSDDRVRRANAAKIGSGEVVCKKRKKVTGELNALTTAPFAGLCTAQCHGNANHPCLCCFFAFHQLPLPPSSSADQQAGHQIWTPLLVGSVYFDGKLRPFAAGASSLQPTEPNSATCRTMD